MHRSAQHFSTHCIAKTTHNYLPLSHQSNPKTADIYLPLSNQSYIPKLDQRTHGHNSTVYIEDAAIIQCRHKPGA